MTNNQSEAVTIAEYLDGCDPLECMSVVVAAARAYDKRTGRSALPTLLGHLLPEESDEDDAAARPWPWVAGTAVLALLFAVQVVHARRNELVRSPSFGPLLAGTYDALGLSRLAPTDLVAYELRQWGAASDPQEANRLMLRASIVNRASYSQPMPLLRLTLRNAGNTQDRELPMSEPLFPAAAIGILPLLRGIEAGRHYRYPVFNPESLEIAVAEQAVEPDVSVPGAAFVVRHRLAGQDGALWLDGRGRVVMETMLGGLLLGSETTRVLAHSKIPVVVIR